MTAHHYYTQLDSRLEALSIPDNAIAMKKYMKNHFEFYGIKSAIRKKAVAEHRREFGMISTEELEEFVHYCWDSPYREVHYSCMEIIEREKKPSVDRLQLYEWMIQNRSWWDSVDFIAPTLIGKLFQQKPGLILENTENYVSSGHLWLQRSALIFQLKYKEQTDLNLLFHYCERLAAEKDFFIRKAIGWSLRQAGKFFPKEVVGFVEKTSLSPLSIKEALKHLKK
jgi:3-methyladenine DNA glycosylase AlkD